MIAVVGRLDDATTVAIARRAARAAATAQLVVTVPPGPDGDRRLAELAAAGVSHAAALRSLAASLETADLDLALRYLPDLRVVVVACDAEDLAPSAAAAADWAGASLIVLADRVVAVPETAIVLAAPAADPDEAFAGLVAALAVRLDAGAAAAAAWREVERELGLEGSSVRRGSGLASAPDRGPSRPR